MVEKKLNFNQPILSVRRCSAKMPSHNSNETKTKNVVPPPRLHPHTPDLNSGPVRNPGAVPFQWEQIPGKPKEETKRQCAEVSPNIVDNGMKDEDCNESLVGEIDSLSRTESFVSSCSISSLNDRDDDLNDFSTTFSMDPEEVKKEVVKQEKPGFWYRPTFAKSCSYYIEKEVCAEDDEKLITICCLLPRSCLKSSACFINPVPATSVMGRFAVFPSADSLSETENEKSTDENKNKGNVAKDIGQLESCDEGLSFVGSRENSFKTLQELLADEDNRKELESTCGDHFNIMSLVDKTSETTSPKPFDSRKTSEEKQQLSRCTTPLGNYHHIPKFPIPPPLPRSPSDSWLFRTMATKKTSTSTSSFISRCANKS